MATHVVHHETPEEHATYNDLRHALNKLLKSEPAEAHPTNPDEAWAALMQGNKRFQHGHLGHYICMVAKHSHPGVRDSLKGSQKPYAVIVSCSDSRVGPEIIFNKGLGQVFVVRIAGTLVDPISVGSVEYALEHLSSCLIVVLGHQSCGAVTAALDSTGGPAPGSIGAIIAKIEPAATAAKAKFPDLTKDKPAALEFAIQQNARNTKAELLKSPIVSELVKEGKVKIITAEYYLDSGEVKAFE